ncbi:MAG: GNAT family N-acetyltransferase [Anaerolineae bacterium]|nr:GNAT family N-acetyltransferase [Anaerolineae bacterium]
MTDSINVTVRGLRSEDTDSLFALWNTGDIIRNSLELPYPSEEAFRERFNNLTPNHHMLAAELSIASGRKRIVGLAELRVFVKRMRHTGRLNLFVHPDFQRAEPETRLLETTLELAGQWLGLRRVEVIVFVDDTNAIALYDHHAFVIEATMRRYARREGVYADAHLMTRFFADQPPKENES